MAARDVKAEYDDVVGRARSIAHVVAQQRFALEPEFLKDGDGSALIRSHSRHEFSETAGDREGECILHQETSEAAAAHVFAHDDPKLAHVR